MAQQSSGEFASTGPPARTQDARVQERGIGAKISLSACSSPQRLQRSTSPHIGKNAPGLPVLGDAYMARSRRRGVSAVLPADLLRAQFGNVMVWTPPTQRHR